ncbi:redoxin [Halorubrum saccharovorum]|uniref:Redoxin n=1 Tax=Halorubrum saccharovorum TaxID=2248 RepID=A0A0F8AXT1_9EURY|nr:TlpA disulfide reductase family protein [Halorubrum saccharovorum]KKF39455.1 redoxin [Halorubrum saccharovorum]
MRRRDLLAGIASVGVLGGAGAVATGNTPSRLNVNGDAGTESEPRGSTGNDDAEKAGRGSGADDGGDPREQIEPTTIDTIAAPGSRDGEVVLPADGRVVFIDFFGTWCGPCEEQMPALGEAADQVGDEALFVSVTNEDVGGALPEEQLADWWREHDGDWLVAADVTAELAAKLNVGGYPTAVVFDSTGRVAWRDSGVHTADEIVSRIETALDE